MYIHTSAKRIWSVLKLIKVDGVWLFQWVLDYRLTESMAPWPFFFFSLQIPAFNLIFGEFLFLAAPRHGPCWQRELCGSSQKGSLCGCCTVQNNSVALCCLPYCPVRSAATKFKAVTSRLSSTRKKNWSSKGKETVGKRRGQDGMGKEVAVTHLCKSFQNEEAERVHT